jgi:hypothetical protein
MTEHHDQVKCPICAGLGRVRRAHLTEFFADPGLKAKIQAYMEQVDEASEDTTEFVTVSVPKPLNFQKEVHRWNPEVPMWRRSPKE